VIDDESLVKTRTNTCLSYTSAVPFLFCDWTCNYIAAAGCLHWRFDVAITSAEKNALKIAAKIASKQALRKTWLFVLIK
jgi:hypothetical protein